MNDLPKKLFIVGSDSAVGKTLVSAILTLGLNASYIKPIQCGVMPCTDTEWIKDITGLAKDHFLDEIYRFADGHEPNTQHTDIDVKELLRKSITPNHEHLIIESTGGVMVPIYGDYFQIDYIYDLDIPVLLVVKNQRGALNQAILSIEKLKQRGISIYGIVLNGPKDGLNRKSIQEYCACSHIFELDEIEHITKDDLEHAFKDCFEKNLVTI